MAEHRNLRDTKSIQDLPYPERAELCRILNEDNRWEELGDLMQFESTTMKLLKNEQNPTETLLKLWGHYHHTIMDLFDLLLSMEHCQAMKQLKSSVAPNYGVLIDEVEYRLEQRALEQIAASKYCYEQKMGVRTVNQGVVRPPVIPEEAASTETKLKLPPIPHEELAIATDQWSELNIVGRGAFGTVYKGIWNNKLVAIKKASEFYLTEPRYGWKRKVDQAFKEVDILTSCHHENILTLYGFGFEGQPPCLVYELMVNGSLSDRLHLKDGTRPLTWMERLKIAKGTARGLLHLHTFRKRPLIHGDIKSGNILLDRFCEPKIGDFGLALTGPEPGSMIKLRDNFGTKPYMADEFLQEKLLSTKIDVYSFGIVMFEIATGLRSYEPSEGYKRLKDFVDNWIIINFYGLQDIKAGLDNQEVYTKLILLGKWCSNRLAKDRPEIDEVFSKMDDMV